MSETLRSESGRIFNCFFESQVSLALTSEYSARLKNELHFRDPDECNLHLETVKKMTYYLESQVWALTCSRAVRWVKSAKSVRKKRELFLGVSGEWNSGYSERQENDCFSFQRVSGTLRTANVRWIKRFSANQFCKALRTHSGQENITASQIVRRLKLRILRIKSTSDILVSTQLVRNIICLYSQECEFLRSPSVRRINCLPERVRVRFRAIGVSEEWTLSRRVSCKYHRII